MSQGECRKASVGVAVAVAVAVAAATGIAEVAFLSEKKRAEKGAHNLYLNNILGWCRASANARRNASKPASKPELKPASVPQARRGRTKPPPCVGRSSCTLSLPLLYRAR